MDRLTELSQLVVSCWRVAVPERPIPTSHGVLDRALNDVCLAEGFPEWARKHLHFVVSRVGLQCVELPAILDRAQKAQLTTAPNPSYSVTEPRITPETALRFLRKLSIPEADAMEWGKTLASAARRAEDELASFERARASSAAAQAE